MEHVVWNVIRYYANLEYAYHIRVLRYVIITLYVRYLHITLSKWELFYDCYCITSFQWVQGHLKAILAIFCRSSEWHPDHTIKHPLATKYHPVSINLFNLPCSLVRRFWTHQHIQQDTLSRGKNWHRSQYIFPLQFPVHTVSSILLVFNQVTSVAYAG